VFDPDKELSSPLALIACDHIHVDPTSKSKRLLGVFVHRRMEVYPASIPLWFYFSFSGGPPGPASVRLRLSDRGDRVGAALLDVSQDLQCGGGRVVREFMASAQVTFLKEVAYLLEGHVAGVALRRRLLFVHAGRLMNLTDQSR
jgi:hypothetical protein